MQLKQKKLKKTTHTNTRDIQRSVRVINAIVVDV